MIRGRQRVKPHRSVRCLAHVVDERSGEAFENGHFKEALSVVAIDRIEKLIGQIVRNKLVVAVERLDELFDVSAIAQGQPSEHQTCGPSLRAFSQSLDRVGADPDRVSVEQPARLVDIEAEIS